MEKTVKIKVPFNKPFSTGDELGFIREAISLGGLSGDGAYTELCGTWLASNAGVKRALLTHSCTAALEMAALVLDIKPGDEIIMPSYTFVSTANAFVLRGAVPVFVDIREDTLNIDETKIESAVTSKTRAIVVVHYAGVACEMDTILEIASRCDLAVVEDAAQAIMAKYKGRPLGGIGDLGALSFHETKNIICGEGGALLISDKSHILSAEIIREKGTDRSQFFRGEVDKYSWQNKGSSYLPSELNAAFLWAQIQKAAEITKKRLAIWRRYYSLTADLEKTGDLRRARIPVECEGNGHIFFILLDSKINREKVLQKMKSVGVHAIFHYVPLHSSPAGLRYGRSSSTLKNTDTLSAALIRLPMWIGMGELEQQRVVEVLSWAVKSK